MNTEFDFVVLSGLAYFRNEES